MTILTLTNVVTKNCISNFLKITYLTVGLCDTSLGRLASGFLASLVPGGGTLTKKFNKSQITDLDTSCKGVVLCVIFAGKDFKISLLSSSRSNVFLSKLKSTRSISRDTSANKFGDRHAEMKTR